MSEQDLGGRLNDSFTSSAAGASSQAGKGPEVFWARVGAIATVAGVVVALYFGIAQTKPETPVDGASTGAAIDSTSAAGELETGSPEQGMTLGDCLSADAEITDCAGEYAGQVFSTEGSCEEGALEAFLGLTGTDVLRPDLDLSPTLDGTGCAVFLQGDGTLTGSLREAFINPRGDEAAQIRYCLDADLRPKSCLGTHHGEVVGVVEDAQSCVDVASEYLGWKSSGLPASLALAARGGVRPECLITVKGENSLNGTLRGIGRRALPLGATS